MYATIAAVLGLVLNCLLAYHLWKQVVRRLEVERLLARERAKNESNPHKQWDGVVFTNLFGKGDEVLAVVTCSTPEQAWADAQALVPQEVREQATVWLRPAR